MFSLTINLDNAAFSDGHLASELARILRTLATKVERELQDTDDFSVRLRDVNGNTVGEAEILTDRSRRNSFTEDSEVTS